MISEQQCGFMLRKRTTDAVFTFSLLIEKYREQVELCYRDNTRYSNKRGTVIVHDEVQWQRSMSG